MSKKIVVIISTSDAGKARTGAMYAINALKHGWMEEVKIIFFGPAQDLLLVDEELQVRVKEYQEIDEAVVACKFIADKDKKSEKLTKIGIQVEYVGEMISNYIHEGYVPMVW
ncbi:MAG: hypothetical protein HN736_00855 [Anaerolineae bacterium]|nr:hypothetical protein [Anaerolineae bacterium]MBT3714259.1 hypothetical protein [Anaerolineae bacterium]MBT4310595.1 hypothetical protein [Anaerolineae bacterium]MBT4458998.1 hypothetical protein [Anaerolineae bacterium]MBT4842612.1 hypothetical protein [Anaerolineae bacterium]